MAPLKLRNISQPKLRAYVRRKSNKYSREDSDYAPE
uniref:Uncharacterized protein n=1 Tax=Rhizophora mucronata TaxID=61149 RepID=A0A2P2N4F6_RHIMU